MAPTKKIKINRQWHTITALYFNEVAKNRWATERMLGIYGCTDPLQIWEGHSDSGEPFYCVSGVIDCYEKLSGPEVTELILSLEEE